MSQESQFGELFKNHQELNKYISLLIENEMDVQTLRLMSNWNIFLSTFQTLKIPIGHIFKIYNLFHQSNLLKTSSASNKEVISSKNLNEIPQGVKTEITPIENSSSLIIDSSMKYFYIGNDF